MVKAKDRGKFITPELSTNVVRLPFAYFGQLQY